LHNHEHNHEELTGDQHCPQHTVHSKQHTAHSTQHTVHSTLYTAHSTQHTAHSTQHNSPQHTLHSPQPTAHNTTAHSTQHITHEHTPAGAGGNKCLCTRDTTSALLPPTGSFCSFKYALSSRNCMWTSQPAWVLTTDVTIRGVGEGNEWYSGIAVPAARKRCSVMSCAPK
jgi:hypothetical protein